MSGRTRQEEYEKKGRATPSVPLTGPPVSAGESTDPRTGQWHGMSRREPETPARKGPKKTLACASGSPCSPYRSHLHNLPPHRRLRLEHQHFVDLLAQGLSLAVLAVDEVDARAKSRMASSHFPILHQCWGGEASCGDERRGYGQPASKAARKATTSEISKAPTGGERSAAGSMASNAMRKAATSEKLSDPNGSAKSAGEQGLVMKR